MKQKLSLVHVVAIIIIFAAIVAGVYLVQKNYELAELGFKKATDLNPTLYQAWFGLATIEIQRNDYAKTVDYLNKTLEVKPDYEKAINLLSKLDTIK